MLLTLVRQPFSAPGWLFELKYDGFRVLTLKPGRRVRLLSRHGNDMAQSFPELVDAVAELGVDELALDGELVVVRDWLGSLGCGGLSPVSYTL
jgi:bifunctional non-homologous end joining protein LigD